MKLPALTANDISALIYKQKAPQASKNTYLVRAAEGVLTRKSGKPTAEQVGSHFGKVGSVTRSRKGRTRRMPNGSRKYNDVGQTVVMY